ncbi:hypothetical protein BJV78DRAFT_935960 [Lactifluus subvellereus]|nr:hypothetical protein BJV78DRAFT_935960 [Lactifluus subvellereus]
MSKCVLMATRSVRGVVQRLVPPQFRGSSDRSGTMFQNRPLWYFAMIGRSIAQAVLSLQDVNLCEVVADEHTHRTERDRFYKGNNNRQLERISVY